MPRSYADAIKAHAKQVAALEGEQAREMRRLLESMQDTLRGRLLREPGGTFDAYRVQAVLAETQAQIRALKIKAGILYSGAETAAADLATEHVAAELDRISMAFDHKPIDVTLDAAAVLADPAQRLLANHFESSIDRYGLDVLNGVRREVFTFLRTGGDYRDAVQRIASERGPLGTVGRANGERLMRTEVSQAYGSAQHTGLKEAAKQVPGLKMVWIHVGSYRCPVCVPLHMTERPLSGTWTIKQGKKTKQVAHPPAHPNCTCRVAAMKASWKGALAKLGYLEPPAARKAA